MKLPFLSQLFQPKEQKLIAIDSLLLKKIKSLVDETDLLIYADKEIFHHKNRQHIPLLIYDEKRGIYLFEIKAWNFNDFKEATISKGEALESSQNSVAFDKKREIIKQKFNELLHNDGVSVFNFLLMENLTAIEYEHLDDSLKEYLPEDKIIFSDASKSEILKKLQSVTPQESSLPSKETILGTLFVQYSIINPDGKLFLCNKKQIELIDTPIKGTHNLVAPAKSGKSYTLLLKSIKELFTGQRKKIIYIKPTLLAKDLQHKYFLEQLEHAIIDMDLMSLEIVTPIEFVNKHLIKLKMPLLENQLHIDQKLIKKPVDLAEFIICDDANLLPQEFIDYLKEFQSKKDLLLVNDPNSEPSFTFSTQYISQEVERSFYKTNPHAKALHLISSLLKRAKAEDILVISNKRSQEKLKEDLTGYIEEDSVIIDASKHLLDQNFQAVLLATYGDIIDISAKHVIMMDLCFTDVQKVKYAYAIAQKSLFVLYEEMCQEVEMLST